MSFEAKAAVDCFGIRLFIGITEFGGRRENASLASLGTESGPLKAKINLTYF